MRSILSNFLLFCWYANDQHCQHSVFAFTASKPSRQCTPQAATTTPPITQLFVNIGLGPDKKMEEEGGGDGDQGQVITADEVIEKRELVPGVDYEIPDHEKYRKSRRSKQDEKCDEWFSKLLGGGEDKGIMGPLADEARKIVLTPVPLVNEVKLPKDDEEYTPYVSTKLPWTPLVPAFGLEEFGLPIPRRNAETWRHFDVPSLVNQDYSQCNLKNGEILKLSEEQVQSYRNQLEQSGNWLNDDACQGRLVYINGQYVPQLSMESDLAKNLDKIDSASDEEKKFLSRLTDGFTDELATPVPIGEDMYASSYKKLSGPNHCLGEPFSQFAINAQQGTACFAALNTRRTGAIAYIHTPEGKESETDKNTKPFFVVNAVTKSGGSSASGNKGMALHPRCLVVAEKNSRLSVVQTSVDLDDESDFVPKFYNGYTQIFVKEGANVTHSYLEESGGMVTAGVEMNDDDVRAMEAARPALNDTHFEAIDVHVMGDDGNYEGTIMSFGGSGRVRIAHSVSLLRPRAHAEINGFSLSGGAQRTDCKTNIHHVAQGTTSEQIQKNMIGGRATGAFRGRIRVEQSAQQTDSQQLSRTVLLSDKSHAWAVPSLEIIADDVKCTHGATVSDLSEEELFYLRSRGLDRTLSRNLLMYAFANDVCKCVDPAMLTSVDSEKGLQKRLIERLQIVVPQGDRAIKGEFQSV